MGLIPSSWGVGKYQWIGFLKGGPNLGKKKKKGERGLEYKRVVYEKNSYLYRECSSEVGDRKIQMGPAHI